MQKQSNLYLETEKSLNDLVIENNCHEQNKELLLIKKEKKSDSYNYKNQATSFIREEIILQHRPPKGSISELIFLNNTSELIEKLSNSEININATDATGSTYSWTPLYWSVKLRRLECIKILLESGGDMNIVINDCDECCGTVLDLATLRDDDEVEEILREYAEKEDVNLGQSFKAIRTKLRGKAPAFNFRYYGKVKATEAA